MNDNLTKNSANIIHAIFVGHHTTRARTSVFHAGLSAIQHALTLHGIPHDNLNLIQCRQALIHHLITGTCFDNFSDTGDVFSSQRHELATCRAVSRGYCSAADVSEAILNIILNADNKEMPTNHYVHVAAAKR